MAEKVAREGNQSCCGVLQTVMKKEVVKTDREEKVWLLASKVKMKVQLWVG